MFGFEPLPLQTSAQNLPKDNDSAFAIKRRKANITVQVSKDNDELKRKTITQKTYHFFKEFQDNREIDYLDWNGKKFHIEKCRDQGTEHIVWKGKEIDIDCEFIFKFCDHKPSSYKRILLNDSLGFKRLDNFIEKNNDLPIRTAKIYTNPLEDGFLAMEHIKPDIEYTWSDKKLENLTETEKEILNALKKIFKTSVERNFDLADFRPSNVFYQQKKFVIIDCTYEDSDENPDIKKMNLIRYIKEWSLNNQDIQNFLTPSNLQ